MELIDFLRKSFIYRLEKPISTIGFKRYPSLRDNPLRSPGDWLQGKIIDDNTQGFWRIHDNLYDFSSFIDEHPGGKDWIRLTKVPLNLRFP